MVSCHRRSIETLEGAITRRSETGSWQIFSFVLFLFVCLDLAVVARRALRRGAVFDATGATSVESASSYFQRLWRVAGFHALVVLILVGGFVAIVRFGPLRPIHEWLQ